MGHSTVTVYSRRVYVLISAIATLTIIIVGYLFNRHESERILRSKYDELSTIAEQKVNQIVRWRYERLADAERVRKSFFLTNAVEKFIKDPNDAVLRAELLQHLKIEQLDDLYDEVQLRDSEGTILLSSTDTPDPVIAIAQGAVVTAFANHQAVISEFYRDPYGFEQVDTIAPLWDANGQPLAAIILSSHVRNYLYPLLMSWPTPSASAETLLARRQGEDVLFLNDLRHRSGTALTLRVPLTNVTVAAVQAVLGKRGIFIGLDYRGIETLADLRTIPDTQWFMVAEVDMSEMNVRAC